MRWEGLKKDAYWAFNLSSTDGVQLLRLSSDKQDVAQQWVKVGAVDLIHSLRGFGAVKPEHECLP